MAMTTSPILLESLRERFGAAAIAPQATRDAAATFWVARDRAHDVLRYLKSEAPRPYRVLFDLTAIDERTRRDRRGQPASDFTVVYDLLSYERNENVRLKVALAGEYPALPTVTDLWSAANWYEREVYDLFGITFTGHPGLRRIMMPSSWVGHPLRKEHPARATEMGPFVLPEAMQDAEQAALEFRPEEWGMARRGEDSEFMFLNMGPQHPGTHGPFRIVLQLDGERGSEQECEHASSRHIVLPCDGPYGKHLGVGRRAGFANRVFLLWS